MYELSLNHNGMTFKDIERKKVYRNKGGKQTCLQTIMGGV